MMMMMMLLIMMLTVLMVMEIIMPTIIMRYRLHIRSTLILFSLTSTCLRCQVFGSKVSGRWLWFWWLCEGDVQRMVSDDGSIDNDSDGDDG